MLPHHRFTADLVSGFADQSVESGKVPSCHSQRLSTDMVIPMAKKRINHSPSFCSSVFLIGRKPLSRRTCCDPSGWCTQQYCQAPLHPHATDVHNLGRCSMYLRIPRSRSMCLAARNRLYHRLLYKHVMLCVRRIPGPGEKRGRRCQVLACVDLLTRPSGLMPRW
jgi:hypothetical protein